MWHDLLFSAKKDVKEFYTSVHLDEHGKLAKDLKSSIGYLKKVSDSMSLGEKVEKFKTGVADLLDFLPGP